MGEVRIWDLRRLAAKPIASFTSPDFTSWGSIKTHHPVDSKVNDTGEDLDRGGVDSEVMTPVRGRFCLHRVRNARSP